MEMEQPGTQPIGPGEKKGGCLKWFAIGCVILIVLAIIAVIFFWVNKERFARWGMAKARDMVVQSLPAEEQVEGTRLFDTFVDRMLQGKLDPAAIQEWNAVLQKAAGDGSVTAEEAREVLDALRKALGETPPPPALPPPVEQPPAPTGPAGTTGAAAPPPAQAPPGSGQ